MANRQHMVTDQPGNFSYQAGNATGQIGGHDYYNPNVQTVRDDFRITMKSGAGGAMADLAGQSDGFSHLAKNRYPYHP